MFGYCCVLLLGVLFTLEVQSIAFPDDQFELFCPPFPDDDEDAKPGELIDPECINQARKLCIKEKSILMKEIVQVKEQNKKKESLRLEEVVLLKNQIEDLKLFGLGEKGNSTHIFQAARDGDLPAVRFYFNQDPTNVNLVDHHFLDNTPLIYASRSGHLNVVDFLVRMGANIDEPDALANMPIIIASNDGHSVIVEYLISKGANMNLQGQHKYTALHWAVQSNRLGTVKVLVKNGADQYIKDEKGRTPLELAQSLERTSIVRFLSSSVSKKK